MVIVMSNGCTNNKEILPNTSDYTKFKAMLFHVMQDLAKRLQKMGKAQPN